MSSHSERNFTQTLIVLVTPICTGIISFVSSFTIIIMIFRSRVKLSTCYRRLFFSMSIFDMIQSLGQAMSTLPMPVGSWVAAVGNNTTCNIQGFMLVLGVNGSLCYGISLSVYFLCTLRYQMSERKIRGKIEPYLHAISIVLALTAAATCFATDVFHPSGTTCTISVEPIGCLKDPDVECKDGRNIISIFGVTFLAGPIFLSMVINCIALFLIWWTEYSQAKKNQQYRTMWSQNTSERANQNNDSPLARHLSRPSKASLQRRKEILRRAVAYIIGFVLTYIFTIIYRLMISFDANHLPPFTIELLRAIFFPLQGFFNIIVYSYTHVVHFHRNHPQYGWLRTFWEVVKSGGDSDIVSKPRGSLRRGKRGSIRKEPVVLDLEEVFDNCVTPP